MNYELNKYIIIESNTGQEDFVVHRENCYHAATGKGTTISATSARSAAEAYIETCYTELDHQLGFGTYRIMPCCK